MVLADATNVAVFPVVAHWAVVILLGSRIALRSRPTNAALAWMVAVAMLPVAGVVLYVLVGERWLSRPRIRRSEEVRRRFRPLYGAMPRCGEDDWGDQRPRFRDLSELAFERTGYPAQPGNTLELIDDAGQALFRLVEEIDKAERYVHFEYYVWGPGGRVDDVSLALERAAKRGVKVRVLVDEVGGRPFFKSEWPNRLRGAGADVAAALPVGFFRRTLARADIRNHRKIAVVDGEVAFSGSQNMADPKAFMRLPSVGEWVDLSFELRGPAVKALELTFRSDWAHQTGDIIDDDPEDHAAKSPLEEDVGAIVQAVPCGPNQAPLAIRDVTVAAIYGARREVVMTTPYFVPDDPMLAALTSAASRGVSVRIVVPTRTDHRLVRWASQAYYADLLDAGVSIERYSEGLLHAKSLTVDGELALIGSANMDIRSFLLNLEITVIVYDRSFATRLRDRQIAYAASSAPVDPSEWRRRSSIDRIRDNAASVFAPLL